MGVGKGNRNNGLRKEEDEEKEEERLLKGRGKCWVQKGWNRDEWATTTNISSIMPIVFSLRHFFLIQLL